MNALSFTILDRFIVKELSKMLLSVTLVLTIILLSNQLVRLLAKAVDGEMSANAVMVLVGFNLITLLARILPAAFLASVLIVFGRMYRDNEMAALYSAGVGMGGLYRSLYLCAIPLAILAGYFSMVVTPWTIQQIEKVVAEDEFQADLRGIAPGRFSEYSRGDVVFYVQELDKHDRMQDVFVQSRQHQKLGITASESGRIFVDPETGDRYILLSNGYRYEGEPGQANFRITRFDEYAVRVAEQKPQRLGTDIKSRETSKLWKAKSPRANAEFHRRLSVPLSILVFALLALPMSRVSPRGGMYGNLLGALLVYVIFENLSNLSHSWLVRELVPSWLGMWWVHLGLVVLGVGLMVSELGPAWVLRRVYRVEAS